MTASIRFTHIDEYHDTVVRNKQLDADENKEPCPYCPPEKPMMVHRANWDKHMRLYHSEMLEPLNYTEARSFQTYEAVIGRGLEMFYAVGDALAKIRDGRLYREQYGTFAEYCEKRWKMTRQRGYQLIQAAGVVDALSTVVDMKPADVVKEFITNEAQARELGKSEPTDQQIIALTTREIAKELGVPVSTPLIKAAAKTYATAMATGAFENGNGEQVKVPDAVVSQVATEVTENIKRQKTYIHSEIERKKERKAAQLATPETTDPTYLFETERTANGLFYVTVRYGMFANAADANAALIQLQKRIEKDCTK